MGTEPPPSWEQLYSEHFDLVWRNLRRFGVRQTADLEDLAAETFLVAGARLASYQGRARARVWLVSIAHNVARAWQRRAHRRRELPAPREEMESMEQMMQSAAETPEMLAQAREALALGQGMLRALPEEERLAYVLHDLEGAEMSEVAEVLGISTTTAEWRAKEARRKLAEAGERLRRRDPNAYGVLFPVEAGLLRLGNEPAPPSARARVLERVRESFPGTAPVPISAPRKLLGPVARVLLPLLGGALAGGAIVYLLLGRPSPAPPTPPRSPAAATDDSTRGDVTREPPPSSAVLATASAKPTMGAPASGAAGEGPEGESLIAAAVADIQAGRPRAALGWLDRHVQKYPRAFRKERDSLRAKALAALDAGAAP
jgi:RNA polymerase sigma-70 factor (ECF subfamily)